MEIPVVTQIRKYNYIITLFHHNENLDYFNTYHLEQINFMKKKIIKDNLPIKIKVYIFTSVPIEEIACNKKIEVIYIKNKDLKCDYIGPNFDIILNNFKIGIKQIKIDEIRYVNILPYEYDLMKKLFKFSVTDDTEFNNLEFNGVKLIEQIDWNNNTIGAKRFVSQALVINKHIKNIKTEFKKCYGYYHWQIDLYIRIGIPSYAKDCFDDNTFFDEFVKRTNPQIYDIANFLYNPPSFRITNICDTPTNDYTDIGEIIVSSNNSEYYTFMIAHFDVKNKVDHFTLGQMDINGVIGYKAINYGTNCIKGIAEKERSPYKPKYTSDNCNLGVNSHYDKFYITNIKTIFDTRAFYNPLFTNWSEDIFFTKSLQTRNLIILPFFLFTYTVKQKIISEVFRLNEYIFFNSTFKAFSGTFEVTDSQNLKLKIPYNPMNDKCLPKGNKINLIVNKTPEYSLSHKTDTKQYGILRAKFAKLLGALNFYYHNKKCYEINNDSISVKTVTPEGISTTSTLSVLNAQFINSSNGQIVIPSNGISKSGCYDFPLKISDEFGDKINKISYENLIYNNFFRIVKVNDKYHLLFCSNFFIPEPPKTPTLKKQTTEMFNKYKTYYIQPKIILPYNRQVGCNEYKTKEPIIETYIKCIYLYLDRCVESNKVHLDCKKSCTTCKHNYNLTEEEELKEKCIKAYKIEDGFVMDANNLNLINIVEHVEKPVHAVEEDEDIDVVTEDGDKFAVPSLLKKRKIHDKEYEMKYLKYKTKYLNLKKSLIAKVIIF